MSDGNLVRAMGVEAAKATPPTLVASYGLVAAHLPEAVGFATLLYLLLQAGHLLWRWRCQVHDRHLAQKAGSPTPPDGDA